MSDELLALPAVPPVPRHERLRRGALGAWWAEGLRTALFMRPRWAGLQVAPATLGVLVLVAFGAAIGVERLYVPGAALFYWPALLADAAWLAVLAWICWVVVPPSPPAGDRAPGGAGLLSLLLAQSLPLTAAIALVMLPMGPGGLDTEQGLRAGRRLVLQPAAAGVDLGGAGRGRVAQRTGAWPRPPGGRPVARGAHGADDGGRRALPPLVPGAAAGFR